MRVSAADLRLDRRDLGLEDAAGKRIDRDLDLLPELDLFAHRRGQRDIGVELMQIGQGDEFRTRRDDLAEIDLAHPEPSGERRLDLFLVDDRLRLQDRGARLVELRLPFIDILLRADLPRCQGPGAFERGCGPARLRLVIGQIGAVGRVVELHQQVAGFDRVARLEHDLGDPPADLGGDGHFLHRGKRADAGRRARHRRGGRLDRRDLRRGRLVAGEVILDRLVAEPVEAVQPAENQREQQPDNDEPAHQFRLRPPGCRVARRARDRVAAVSVQPHECLDVAIHD